MRRERPVFLPTLLTLLTGILFSGGIVYLFLMWETVERPIAETDGVKQVSSVVDSHLAVYDGTNWSTQFWNGVNLGATLPGHSPGDLAPSKDDYLRWFEQMREMNTDVVRVYTILPPHFYEALYEFNSTREDTLWLIQGIWSPEEKLIGDDEMGQNAYDTDITEQYHREISNAVRAVHGDAYIPQSFGHASGEYETDVSEYMLGWMVGTEWYPYAVQRTDDANAGLAPFSGEYFRATEDATPFESWLAESLDVLAKEEMRYGWQHPASFTNWLTTDPLSHPNEPFEKEDLVPVDPMHVEPTEAWKAGYFAQYHAYSYYPDFLRYQMDYQTYEDSDGEVDPYAAYLNELRAHHEGIPLLVGEFGVPSSRGLAHYGPLGRDQGYHSEEEQGEMDAEMLHEMRREGLDGGIVFAWHDEWFKFTWNTIDLELPRDRRQNWRNRLTNEENFGVIATEAGESPEQAVQEDGATEDWDRRVEDADGNLLDWLPNRPERRIPQVRQREYEGFDLSVSHDEAYVHLLLQKHEGEWDFSEEELDLGFGTLPDGSPTADPTPGLTFPDGGIQFLLQMRGEEDSRMLVNSGYDQHIWLYVDQLGMLTDPGTNTDVSAGQFLPWTLAVSRGLYLPQTRENVPFEEVDVGVMRKGISDPLSPEFDNLADWYAEGSVLEIRVPWMLLGFTDPSSLQVWDYPYEAAALEPVTTEGLRVYPALRPAKGSRPTEEVETTEYTWEGWDQPTFYERKKESFYILSESFRTGKQLEEPRIP